MPDINLVDGDGALYEPADRLYGEVQANHALNDWDRASQLPPLAQNFKVCRGEAPASTIAQPQ
jgi:hypothetical protein